jgi:DNA invertase Pin-like site-specific DNA recombinase
MFRSPLRRKFKPISKANDGQYELVDEARRRGFQYVEVIDDDLGRSASGMTARPGFERLVAWLRHIF